MKLINEYRLNKTFQKLFRENYFGDLNERSEIKDLNYYVNVAQQSGLEGEMAQQHVEQILSKIRNLPQELKLYRVVFVEDPSQIDDTKIGNHYVMKQKDLDNSHYVHSHVGGGSPYLLTVKAPLSLVDTHQTIINNILYPHENEITLKNEGIGASIINVSPFKPKSSEDDFLSQGFDDDFGMDFY